MEFIDTIAPLQSPRVSITSNTGFIELNLSAMPPMASSAVKIYGDASGRFSLLGPTGASVTIDSAGLTAARLFSFPDHDGTLSTLAGVESLTNKSIIGTSNTVHASHLRTSGAPVSVFGAAPPLAGAVLTAISSTSAQWAAPNSARTFSIQPMAAAASSTNYTAIGYLTYSSRLSGFSGMLHYFLNAATTIDIRVYDETNLATLGQAVGLTGSGAGSLSFTNPVSSALISLQIRRQTAIGAAPQIIGSSLEFV